MEWAVLNRCVLSCDLKWGNESMFLSWGVNEFQRRGAECPECSAPHSGETGGGDRQVYGGRGSEGEGGSGIMEEVTVI